MKSTITWTTVDINDKATWPEGAMFRRANELVPDHLECWRVMQDGFVSWNKCNGMRMWHPDVCLAHGDKWSVIE